MTMESGPRRTEVDITETAMRAHCRRVSVAAVEVGKRLGWSIERQQELREAADSHHHSRSPLNLLTVARLLADVCGSPGESAAGQPERTSDERATLIELCCFFVQRWEFVPYELLSYAEIMNELRAMAREDFFPSKLVEALAVVPTVRVENVREAVARLPVFPAIALRAMKLAQNSNASLSQLEEVVGADAVLAGEILHAANSPLYAPAMPIRTIRHAVLMMGIPECCRIITAAAFRPIFQSPLVRPLWNHSLEVARLAETLARTTGKSEPEEAFLAGLMHDVGRLALWKLQAKLSSHYTSLLENGCEPMFAETILCGFDHSQAGREVMTHWRLPLCLAEAIEFHHQPERTESMLAQVLYLAEHCSASQEDLPSMARLQHALHQTGLEENHLRVLPGNARPGLGPPGNSTSS